MDTYHGVSVEDPYRWLEDDTDPDRGAWIAEQNAVTEDRLSMIPARQALRNRLKQLLRYPRYYDFLRRGPYLLYKKNDGLQNQLVLCGRFGLTGAEDILVDPLKLASDGTITVTSFAISHDARYLAYGISEGGSDWQEIRVKELQTRRDLSDRVQWVKGSLVAWLGRGFFYSRYPEPPTPMAALSARNEYHEVWYHHLGTLQVNDALIYRDRQHPHGFHFVQTTDDERFVVLTIIGDENEHSFSLVGLLRLEPQGWKFSPLLREVDTEFRLVDSHGRGLLYMTNYEAPNWRLVLIDVDKPQACHWQDVIPEQTHALQQVAAVGGKLFAIYRQDATNRLYVVDRSGRFEHDVPLPQLGSVRVFPGNPTDEDVLWSFASFTTPPTVFLYNIGSRDSRPFLRPAWQCATDSYQTHQVWYSSKDGTRIPMFLVHRKDLSRDGGSPLLLYGYGGNALSVGPAFDPLLMALLERGVTFAVPCLRGGGEYGEEWHRAGWRSQKQTVFDDCIAALEWLHTHGVTSSDRTGLIGASNGGLLVGAIMTQRPDLLAAAVPSAGVLDMLRFHHFTIGHLWISEYGVSDDAAMFPTLLAYSPVHNVRAGVRYPATLVITSEHDDRVVPAHSFKFIATLQARGTGPGPYLIRIDRQSGHGAVSLPKEIAERADIYAFLLAHLPGTTEPPGAA